MADIITGTTTGFVNNMPDQTLASVSDVRREAAEHTNEIVKESIKGDWHNTDAIKDARYDINTQSGNNADRVVDRVSESNRQLTDRFFQVGRDTQDIRAQVIAQQQQMVAGFMGVAKDAEINALKTQVELAKQTTYLSDKIDAGNEKTRDLMSELRDRELNRYLIERNAEIVEERHGRRHWHHVADQNQAQGQWAALQSQLAAFQSQLQETRQGMVNFGTMAGVGQTSTSNNVR